MSRTGNPIQVTYQATARAFRAALRTPVGYLCVAAALMLGFYAVLYQPYDPATWPGTWLASYLNLCAQASAAVLTALGEAITLDGTHVLGRFRYAVVLDCAALDAQALFAAAVLAFPASLWKRAAGLVVGLTLIFLVNTARLVLLYYAGARSFELFQTLHEEVFVFAVIALVCLIFVGWAMWARDASVAPPAETPAT